MVRGALSRVLVKSSLERDWTIGSVSFMTSIPRSSAAIEGIHIESHFDGFSLRVHLDEAEIEGMSPRCEAAAR